MSRCIGCRKEKRSARIAERCVPDPRHPLVPFTRATTCTWRNPTQFQRPTKIGGLIGGCAWGLQQYAICKDKMYTTTEYWFIYLSPLWPPPALLTCPTTVSFVGPILVKSPDLNLTGLAYLILLSGDIWSYEAGHCPFIFYHYLHHKLYVCNLYCKY